MAAVQKLQSVIQMVQSEMAAAQEAAERCMTKPPPAVVSMLYWQAMSSMLCKFLPPTHETHSLQSTCDIPHPCHPPFAI